MMMKKLSEEHYIICDDSEIKTGDWVVSGTKTIVQCMYPENVHHEDIKKITHSTQPLYKNDFWAIQELKLSEVKKLLGVVDKAFERYPVIENDKDHNDRNYYRRSAYYQALEDNKEKKYTEEDIRKTWEAGMRFIGEDKGSYGEFIQSLQPKTEWEVEIVDGKLKLI